MSPAQVIFNRLSNVEKMDVYKASRDRLAWLGQNDFRGDMILIEVAPEDREDVMFDVQAFVVEDYNKTLQKHCQNIDALCSN